MEKEKKDISDSLSIMGSIALKNINKKNISKFANKVEEVGKKSIGLSLQIAGKAIQVVSKGIELAGKGIQMVGKLISAIPIPILSKAIGAIFNFTGKALEKTGSVGFKLGKEVNVL